MHSDLQNLKWSFVILIGAFVCSGCGGSGDMDLQRASTKELDRLIKSGNARERHSAVAEFNRSWRHRPASDETVPILINALTDKDNDIRHSIVWCLRNYPGRKGNHQAEIIAALCRSLEDSDARVRKVAAITLAEDEVRTAEAYEAMKNTVKDSDKEVKTRAIGFMSKFPDRAAESVEVLVQAATDEDPAIRFSALSALSVTLHTPKSAPLTIVKLLADDDQNVRDKALYIFLRYESDQKKVADTLVDRFKKEENLGIKKMLIHRMWERKGGTQDIAYIRFLAEGVENQDKEIRSTCALVLSLFAGTPEKRVPIWEELAVPAYIKASKDGDAEFRESAIRGLAFADRSDLVTPILVAALTDNDRRVRVTAALTIRGAAIPHRHSPNVQFAKSAVPALIRMLKSEDPHEIHAAMTALQNFGPDAKAAVPTLLEERNKKRVHRWEIDAALKEIDPSVVKTP